MNSIRSGHIAKSSGQPLIYNGYVQTCINGDYQQRYVYDILRELFSKYDFDGLFCNMSSTFVVDYELQVHEPLSLQELQTIVSRTHRNGDTG